MSSSRSAKYSCRVRAGSGLVCGSADIPHRSVELALGSTPPARRLKASSGVDRAAPCYSLRSRPAKPLTQCGPRSNRRVFFYHVKYQKPALTYEQQSDLLLLRGLVADREVMIRRLTAVGYYRLCAYWHPFKRADDSFEPGTELAVVWRRYIFDRRLRLSIMDAIERFEIAARCAVVNRVALEIGPFGHLDPKNLPNNSYPLQHQHFCEELRKHAKKSSELFVKHFSQKYDEFPDLPIWAAGETMSFGTMLSLCRMSPTPIQKGVAHQFGLEAPVFQSWLSTLNYVRNLCAHHARVWNRELAIKPLIPVRKHDARWHGNEPVRNDRVFAVLTQLRYLMCLVAPHSEWRERLWVLFDDYEDVPIARMGIPASWRAHELWR